MRFLFYLSPFLSFPLPPSFPLSPFLSLSLSFPAPFSLALSDFRVVPLSGAILRARSLYFSVRVYDLVIIADDALNFYLYTFLCVRFNVVSVCLYHFYQLSANFCVFNFCFDHLRVFFYSKCFESLEFPCLQCLFLLFERFFPWLETLFLRLFLSFECLLFCLERMLEYFYFCFYILSVCFCVLSVCFNVSLSGVFICISAVF